MEIINGIKHFKEDEWDELLLDLKLDVYKNKYKKDFDGFTIKSFDFDKFYALFTKEKK